MKTYDQLHIDVPEDNLTILGLARKLAANVTRPPVPTDPSLRETWAAEERTKLGDVIRYSPVSVESAWPVSNTNHNQVESISYRFEFGNGLSATGVWMKEASTEADAPLTIVLNDGGTEAAANEEWDLVKEVGDRLARGQQVLAVNLVFFGDAAPDITAAQFTQMLAAEGERPLGLETAQLVSLAGWAKAQWSPQQLRVETTGPRTQVITLAAATLQPHLFSQVETWDGMDSFSYLLDKPVNYLPAEPTLSSGAADAAAPDLFCLDLYKDFDIDRLVLMANPTQVVQQHYLQAPSGIEAIR